jgi:hypothetical protein
MLNLNTTRASLQQIQGQLIPLMDAFFKGASDKETERNSRLRQLQTIQDRLSIMIRDLNSAQHLQDVRQSGLGNVPRDARYSAEQSIKQRQKDLAAFRIQAEDLAEAVRNIFDANGFLSPTHRAMKLGDLVENIMKAAENQHSLSELGISNGPAYSAIHDTTPLSGIVPVFVFIYLAIQKLRQKSSDAKNTKNR